MNLTSQAARLQRAAINACCAYTLKYGRFSSFCQFHDDNVFATQLTMPPARSPLIAVYSRTWDL